VCKLSCWQTRVPLARGLALGGVWPRHFPAREAPALARPIGHGRPKTPDMLTLIVLPHPHHPDSATGTSQRRLAAIT
jgi:hypothetical protein